MFPHIVKFKESPLKPSIAWGNQTCNPIWELLAIAPINKQIPIIVTTFSLMNGANENTVA